MKKDLNLLIVSGLENRGILSQILAGLPVNVFTATSIAQAQELLFSQPIQVVFCEERLPDGSFRDLLRRQFVKAQATRWVVLLTTGEWAEYLEALKLGATDAVRCPVKSTDVDLALIRATRNMPGTEFPSPLSTKTAMSRETARLK
jgi:DNA-binding NtrC family response regulator